MSAPDRVIRARESRTRVEDLLAPFGPHSIFARRVRREVEILVRCVTDADEFRRAERTRRVQAEALLAQLTTPSPTTPEPETVPL